MASSAFNANINVVLNSQSLNASTKQVQQALGRITGNASEFQKSLDASTARVFAFGATTAVINGVTQSFSKLAAATIDVERRLIEIQSIFGGTAKEFGKFRDSIFEVARNTGQSFATVADAAAEFARQGLSAAETAKRLNAALILTRVSGLDSVKSVEALTAAINGYSTAGLTAEQITNKLIAVDTAFAVSAQDLAEGFSRAGSTAEDAGVSFNELLGIITAVQQKTARGGAVIGNALKSIFTRLSRGSTIDDLRALGVEIDASQTGIQKLKALSAALEKVSDPTVASQIKELAGGVFQINVVSAALKDLSSETSLFTQATKTAAEASDEAFVKNAALNKSLAAQLNALVVNVTNLGEKIGQLTFAPVLSNLVSLADKFSTFLNEALDPEKGNKFIQGLFKVIGSFLSGPAVVLFTTAFVKIFALVARYAQEGLGAILKIGTSAEKLASIQTGIVNSLKNDDKFRKAIESKTLSIADKQKIIADAIKRENDLLRDQERILLNISKIAMQQGVTGFTPEKGFAKKSGGYIPNFAAASPQDVAMESMGARKNGYKAGAVYNTEIFDGFGGSETVTMNGAEQRTDFINSIGKKATIIEPPNGFSQDAIKEAQSRAGGFIPNFAGRLPLSILRNKVKSIKGNPTPSDQSLIDELKERESQQTPTIPANKLIGTRTPTILTPVDATKKSRTKDYKALGYKVAYDFQGIPASGSEALESKFEKNFKSDDIQNFAKEFVLEKAQMISSGLGLSPAQPDNVKKIISGEGYKGALRAASGAMFDAAVNSALQYSVKNKKGGGNFDVRLNAGETRKNIQGDNVDLKDYFKTLFGGGAIPESGLADFKYSASDSAVDSMIGKIEKEYSRKFESRANSLKDGGVKSKNTKGKNGKSGGYIPNFAALQDSIGREMAAGVPKSQIYIDQDNRLKGPQNPTGAMVANSIDEPLGGKQGISRALQSGINPKKHGMASGGYIPNFAPAKIPTISAPAAGGANIDTKQLNNALRHLAMQLKRGNISVSKASREFDVVVKAQGAHRLVTKDLSKKGKDLMKSYEQLAKANRKAAMSRASGASGKVGMGGKIMGKLKKGAGSNLGMGFGLSTLSTSVGPVSSSLAKLAGANEGTAKMVEEFGSSTASMAAVGATMAGPWGAAIGAVVGAATGFVKAMQENRKLAKENAAAEKDMPKIYKIYEEAGKTVKGFYDSAVAEDFGIVGSGDLAKLNKERDGALDGQIQAINEQEKILGGSESTLKQRKDAEQKLADLYDGLAVDLKNMKIDDIEKEKIEKVNQELQKFAAAISKKSSELESQQFSLDIAAKLKQDPNSKMGDAVKRQNSFNKESGDLSILENKLQGNLFGEAAQKAVSGLGNSIRSSFAKRELQKIDPQQIAAAQASGGSQGVKELLEKAIGNKLEGEDGEKFVDAVSKSAEKFATGVANSAVGILNSATDIKAELVKQEEKKLEINKKISELQIETAKFIGESLSNAISRLKEIDDVGSVDIVGTQKQLKEVKRLKDTGRGEEAKALFKSLGPAFEKIKTLFGAEGLASLQAGAGFTPADKTQLVRDSAYDSGGRMNDIVKALQTGSARGAVKEITKDGITTKEELKTIQELLKESIKQGGVKGKLAQQQLGAVDVMLAGDPDQDAKPFDALNAKMKEEELARDELAKEIKKNKNALIQLSGNYETLSETFKKSGIVDSTTALATSMKELAAGVNNVKDLSVNMAALTTTTNTTIATMATQMAALKVKVDKNSEGGSGG
ncbi:phage tail tape measure protein [bacterium]|nr:phage tail tape measure protein [bacterium]